MTEGFVSQNIIDKYSTLYFLQQPQPWKEYTLKKLFRNKNFITITNRLPKKIHDNACVLTWGTRSYSATYQRLITECINTHPLKCVRLESGFFNSIRLGASGTIPVSLCFDDLGMYYDATAPSRLETMLETYNLDQKILKRAETCIDYVLDHGISKVNCLPHLSPEDIYGKKNRQRILVIDQVADDESITRGVLGPNINSYDLVRLAIVENPDAEIIYRIHPEVLAKYRKGGSVKDLLDKCKILSLPCSIDSALKTIDKIYTISSTVGFEGLLRNIPVTCLGTPFYSGWGLTDDRDIPCKRRTRKRTVEELFAISAIAYPDYFDPKKIVRISVEKALECLQNKSKSESTVQLAVKEVLPLKITVILYFKKIIRAFIKKAQFIFSYFNKDRLFHRLWKIFHPAKTAFLYGHYPLTKFLHSVNKYATPNIHFIHRGSEHTHYKKVIIPNGLWPSIKKEAAKIPANKKLFMEVGFFPQDDNIYFDIQGIHGYSSVRNANLPTLDQNQAQKLEEFRSYYTSKNFVKYAPGCMAEFNPDNGKEKYHFRFILVILQSERDTAFKLCPFQNNQEIVHTMETLFPDEKIIFKVHPDEPALYQIKPQNILLPAGNTDLRELIIKSSYVISGNSTVLLEALMHKKICASFGEGFSTNHNVCLECHENINHLKKIHTWEPAWEKVDRFLYYMLEKQIHYQFWKNPEEFKKLHLQFQQYGIL